jgi:uncharacterized protein (TIGR03437 family)
MKIIPSILFLSALPAFAQTLPPGFVDRLVGAVPQPTAIAFFEDGRALVTSQGGTVRLLRDGAILPAPVLTLTAICTNSERGLLGVAIDPDQERVYLFYTYRGPGRDCTNRTSTTPVNRVSSFLYRNGAIDPATELVLIDDIPSFNSNHNGGDVQIGKDGWLYVSVGDNGCDPANPSLCNGQNPASRNPQGTLGKILRVPRTGGPYQIYAMGLRNPFRIAMDPNSSNTRFFINDVGQERWEEIDEAIQGGDYGWNVREGPCPNGAANNCSPDSRYIEPLWAYTHESGCSSISAGAFVPNGYWNPEYDGVYLFGDFVCGRFFQTGARGAFTEFARGFGSFSLIHATFYRGDLYYTTYANGGQVRRIVANVAANAASFVRGTVAANGIATIFGTGLAGATEVEIGGLRAAPFFTTDSQANFVVPNAPSGRQTFTVRRGAETVASGPLTVERVSPGLFSAGQALVLRGDGSRETLDLFAPLPVRDADVYLVLYGSGFRNATGVTTNIGDLLYAGPQMQYDGLDQINIRLPRTLAPGSLVLRLGADGRAANVLTLTVR